MEIIKSFYRKCVHNKQSFLINILSLIPGLVCCLLIFSWILFQVNFDKFHSKIDRILLVRSYADNEAGREYSYGSGSSVASAIKQDFPEVEQSAAVAYRGGEICAGDQKFYLTYAYADPEIFQILDINLIEGELYEKGENKCVISDRYAKALFGGKSAIGEFVSIGGENRVVSGILKEDWPRNSSFHFAALLPLDIGFPGWSDNHHANFALLDKAENIPLFQEKIKDQYKDLMPKDCHLDAYKFQDRHLVIEGNQSRVYLLGVLALFLLFVACINFVNLATASFMTESLQTGIHKIMGATRLKLMCRYMCNVFFLVLLAFMLALALAVVCLPVFASLIGQAVIISDYYNWPVVLLCVGMIVFTTLFSGLYPAIFLSSFQPINALKSKNPGTANSGFFRNALVSVQFIISIVLIISILTISKQINMYNGMDLGYEREEIIYVDLQGTDQSRAFVLKQELLKDPSIVAVSACCDLPTNIGWNGGWDWEGAPADFDINFYFTHVDSDWAKVMGIKMQEGIFFSDDNPGVIINQEVKKIIGWGDCKDKYLDRGDRCNFKITGVMDKFLFGNFKLEQKPLVICPLKENVYDLKPSYLVVRVRGNQLIAMHDLVKNKAKEINGTDKVGFLNELTQNFLREEQQTIKIVSLFSGLAIVISCLGLFGMATYVMQWKRKEIGIRRVNGAKVSEIIWLLNINFIRPIAVAFVISCPIAYYLMSHWLAQYLYRVAVGWDIFVFTGLITVAVVVLTLTWKSRKAATENPVESLKSE